MPSVMSAEEFCAQHGSMFVAWLQDNTIECACEDKYACDQSARTSGMIDAETMLECRRCFVPVGKEDVSVFLSFMRSRRRLFL